MTGTHLDSNTPPQEHTTKGTHHDTGAQNKKKCNIMYAKELDCLFSKKSFEKISYQLIF
jgi:hypothetical protein